MKPGDKITYSHPEDGEDADKARAAKVLKLGCGYVIKAVEVSLWRTDLTLHGLTGKFNSVMFEVVA